MIKLLDKQLNNKKYDIVNYQIEVFPLDNFSPFGLIMNNLFFPTSEHAFQYLKFIDTNKDRPSNWSEIKYDKMEEVLRIKVNQNIKVKEVLLNTNDLIIAECCIDEDTDWGIDNNNQGNNHLGNIWMKIREEIKNVDNS